MKILIIDNYDSFTYNLVHLVESIVATEVTVWRNDAFNLDDVAQFDYVILSPGPGVPKDAGLLLAVIKKYMGAMPILGVCLGHQAIAEALGGSLINLDKVYHGVATPCTIVAQDAILLQGLTSTFTIGRYHSWVAAAQDFPAALRITAKDENGQIMAFEHKEFQLHGVQFHPESILTPDGKIIMSNFLAINTNKK